MGIGKIPEGRSIVGKVERRSDRGRVSDCLGHARGDRRKKFGDGEVGE